MQLKVVALGKLMVPTLMVPEVPKDVVTPLVVLTVAPEAGPTLTMFVNQMLRPLFGVTLSM